MIKGTFRRCIVVLFALVILTPLMFAGFSLIREEMKFDVSVNGYFDPVTEPEFSMGTLASGDFQTQFNDWFANTFKPRNVLIKTYNTIQYYLFHEGNREIGGHGSVFEANYCKAEYCTEDEYDFSLPERVQKTEELVNQMVEVKDKLEACGKGFLVYLTPSKAHWAPQDVPYRYRAQRRSDGVRGLDCLTALLEKTEIPYLNAYSYSDAVPYPEFYATGIHWARPIEQTVDNAVVSKAGQLAGKNYRTIKLGEAVESSTPFWRDADVYDLLNIWEVGGGRVSKVL